MGAEHEDSWRTTADSTGALLSWLGNARARVTRATQAEQTTAGHISRFPYQTVAMAVALGFLIGLMWSRR